MKTVHRTPSLTLTPDTAAELNFDFLVVPIFEDDTAFGDDTATDPLLARVAGPDVRQARTRRELTGKLYEVFLSVVPNGPAGRLSAGASAKAGRVAFVGAGTRADFTPDRLRRVAVTGGLTTRRARFTRLTFLGRPSDRFDTRLAAQVIAEGLTIANFEGGSYKSDDEPCVLLESAEIRLEGAGEAEQAALARGIVLGECTNIARELANEPGNHLTPRRFADRAVEIATGTSLQVEVLDEARIASLNMGLLLGVARGSQEPPRLVVLSHEPAQALPGVTLGLVGKGITFDTGGISIKPAENMDRMKDDMSGGAAVIAALAAIARLNVPVRCLGIVPMTENMPGGKAVKPGDVLTSAAGKTVEILNTDAEGRLVLGDGVWYARQLGATHLIDVATLTGACVVALGKTTSGLFGTPDEWVAQVQQASERAGDRSWPLPVFDDYKEQLKSEIADFTNTGGRAGGAITGALFIREFAGDLPWVHIDIAGTAWAEEPKPYQPKGATGVAVRTLVELAMAAESWSKLKMGR
jgi:leucyl aminopeptidase